jgi:hypothetical protein
VNVGFSGFSGGCSGESLGMPCGMTLPDNQAMLARQMIIAAIKGDWKSVLGLGLAPLEQQLWSGHEPDHGWRKQLPDTWVEWVFRPAESV